MRVAVCIPSYLRPHGLERLLRALERLAFERMEAPEVEVVVVDNDAAASAREVCDRLRPDYRWPLRYVVEPRRGISFARNSAVEAAQDRSDFIAFIDDDEEPDAAWLEQLLLTGERFAADVVTGPVERRFEAEVPDWVVGSGLFTASHHPTGEEVALVGTGNALIRSRVFRGMDRLFDERLALTGGEDTEFFQRVARAGHRIVWSEEALVHEWIPESRTRVPWLLRRSFRMGITTTQREREQYATPTRAALRFLRRTGRFGQEVLRLPLALLRGRGATLKAMQDICYRAGDLAGMTGVRYEEYRTTHGD